MMHIACRGSREGALHAGIVIETGTFTQLAAASLNANRFEQAEMMLEQRDYL